MIIRVGAPDGIFLSLVPRSLSSWDTRCALLWDSEVTKMELCPCGSQSNLGRAHTVVTLWDEILQCRLRVHEGKQAAVGGPRRPLRWSDGLKQVWPRRHQKRCCPVKGATGAEAQAAGSPGTVGRGG